MANILVTGGAGFIGSHLVTHMVERGHTVRVFDNFATGKRENLAHLTDRFEMFEGDMRDPAQCVEVCRDVEFVFHEAAIPSVPKSVDDPQTSHDANINGTFNMLRAAVDRKVRRLIYAGSSSAYGEADEPVKHEGIVPAPLSPYAVNKLVGEHYLRAFYECYGLQTISLRYFNVFGPRQDPQSQYAAAIPAFVSAILRDESPTIYGDGEQTRDFIYVADVARANLAAMESETSGVFNVGMGGKLTINELARVILEAAGSTSRVAHGPPAQGDIFASQADITRITQGLGWAPESDFREALEWTVAWFRK